MGQCLQILYLSDTLFVSFCAASWLGGSALVLLFVHILNVSLLQLFIPVPLQLVSSRELMCNKTLKYFVFEEMIPLYSMAAGFWGGFFCTPNTEELRVNG